MRKRYREFDPRSLYEYDRKKNVFSIKLSIDTYNDLYDEWDYSPFRKRDLDKNLLEHLEECSREIPLKHRLAVHFYMPTSERDASREERSIAGLRNYFQYLLYKKAQEKKKYNIYVFLYIISGLLLLTGAYFLQGTLETHLLLTILPEGLFIGGWVLFWEAFSILFFKSREMRQNLREYKRLIQAEIHYTYIRVENG